MERVNSKPFNICEVTRRMLYYCGFRLPWSRFHVYRLVVSLVPVPRRRIKKWFDEKRVFFVVGSGRSGTKWLAETLNHCDDTIVEHEPVPREGFACREAIEVSSAERYIREFRLKEIYLRLLRDEPFCTYGEVNSRLRRHVLPIIRLVPNVTIIHLVRDPREVVVSQMSRRGTTSNHPVYGAFRPPVVDKYSSCWKDLTEFERVCWLWQWDNRCMRECTWMRARLEDLVSSYSCFKSQILDPVGIELEEVIWKSAVRNPKNVTSEFKMGPYSDWTAEQREQFICICGKEMEQYGYEI